MPGLDPHLESANYSPPPLKKQKREEGLLDNVTQLNKASASSLSAKGKIVSKLAQFADAIVMSTLKTATKVQSEAGKAIAALNAKRRSITSKKSITSNDANVRFQGLSALKYMILGNLEPTPPKGVVALLTEELKHQKIDDDKVNREAEGTATATFSGKTLTGTGTEQLATILNAYGVTQRLTSTQALSGRGTEVQQARFKEIIGDLQEKQDTIKRNIRNLFQASAASDLEERIRDSQARKQMMPEIWNETFTENLAGGGGVISQETLRYEITSPQHPLVFARDIHVGPEKTTITFKMPYPIRDKDDLNIVGYCGCYRQITISNEDLARDWIGKEGPPSLKCHDHIVPMKKDLGALLKELEHPDADHPPVMR